MGSYCRGSQTMGADRDNEQFLKTLALRFGKETSLHGIKYPLDTLLPNYRRITWLIILLGLVIAFTYVMVGHVLVLVSLPTMTRFQLSYVKRLPFPAVTICNMNMVKRSTYDNNPQERDIVEKFVRGNFSYFENIPPEEYAKLSIGRLLMKGFLSMEDTIKYCSFNEEFSCKDYIRSILTEQGRCFTVNGNITGSASSDRHVHVTMPNLLVTRSGIRGGLRLDVDIQQSEYINVNYTPPGIKVFVHNPDEIPSIDQGFLVLPPGTVNYINIGIRKANYLPSPYQAFEDNYCIERDALIRHRLKSAGKYTLRACVTECEARRRSEICGCELLNFKDLSKECAPLRHLNCSWMFMFSRYNKTSANEGIHCDCPIPCDDVIYHTSLSSTQLFGQEWYKMFGDDKSALVRHNNIRAYLYFDRLIIESTEQVEVYNGGDILASFGGQMGLFLGASMITVAELVELFTVCIRYCILRWRWRCPRVFLQWKNTCATEKETPVISKDGVYI